MRGSLENYLISEEENIWKLKHDELFIDKKLQRPAGRVCFVQSTHESLATLFIPTTPHSFVNQAYNPTQVGLLRETLP